MTWEKIVERFADGRPLCNCRRAYLKPVGLGFVNGEWRNDMLTCEHGCSAAQITVRNEIAARLLSGESAIGDEK